MKCPMCNLENPESAQRCDCGYDFPSGEMKQSYLSQKEQEIIQTALSGRRFINLIVDMILFRIAGILLLVPFLNTDFIQTLTSNPGLDWLFGICLLFFYYFIFEAVLQRTPAKFVTGTKVIMQDGSKPDIHTIAMRTLSTFVPFEPLSGNNGTYWHDRWTKTRVVRA